MYCIIFHKQKASLNSVVLGPDSPEQKEWTPWTGCKSVTHSTTFAGKSHD